MANAKDVLLERKPTVRFVKIDVENSDGGVEISIEDSAGGIAEDIIEEHLGGKIGVENTPNGARFRKYGFQRRTQMVKFALQKRF